MEALGITTVLDLLTHYPRRYIDATRQAPVSDLVEGDRVTVLGEVVRVSQSAPGYGRGRGRRPGRVEVVVSDGRDRLRVVFFNQAWRARQLAAGTAALFFGTVSSYRDALQMVNPIVDVLARPGDDEATAGLAADRRRVFPVYPLSEKADLTSAALTRLVAEALDRAGPLADPVDAGWLDRFGLVDRTTAFTDVHRPRSVDATEPARRRLAFDELLRLQVALVLRQARLQADARGIAHVVATGTGAPTLAERFLADLPFPLTGAQRRAVDEITADLAAPLPMHRLLQGDVGAGKTVVATAAMLVAVEGGHQAALMAPTEVLAEQHAAEIRRLVGELTVASSPTARRPGSGPPCTRAWWRGPGSPAPSTS
jgi:ATP-dependent DNA helicase RecG